MTKDEKKTNNFEVFMEKGPGLSYRYRSWIDAKSPDGVWILKGGLGGMGCGQMWFKASDEERKSLEYAEAPIQQPIEGMSMGYYE